MNFHELRTKLHFNILHHPPVLHLCIAEKFIAPLIRTINTNFSSQDHHFVITKPKPKIDYDFENVSIHKSFLSKVLLTFKIYRAKKIILHGLYDSHFLYFLAAQPWLAKKCYWVIWGGDLYQYLLPKLTLKSKIKEFFRALLIRNLGHLVTCVEGDYRNANDWYKATGRWHKCLAYLSNTFTSNSSAPTSLPKSHISIQVGNSAFQRNNHFMALKEIAKFQNDNIKIYCPLSYGPQDYAKIVCEFGGSIFGDKFIPLLTFMPLEQYNELQREIDIGVFAQDAQQAMGNMIQLLGLGKKIYIRRNTTPWDFFVSQGLHVYDIDQISLDPISVDFANENRRIIANNFSPLVLVQQYRDIFQFE